MHIKSLFLTILTAFLIQSACSREDKKYKGGLVKFYRSKQRSNVGEARFTSDILNKLKEELKTTTPKPTITSTWYTLEPTLTSDTGAAGTYTSAATGSDINPGTVTSASYGSEPDTITTDTDNPYSVSSSTPGAGDELITSDPDLSERPQQPAPDNVAPVEDAPLPALASTSRIADAEGIASNDNSDEEDLHNDDVNENIVSYDNLNDLKDNKQMGRSSRPLTANWPRNQLNRNRSNQQAKRRRLRNRANSQKRRRVPNRSSLNRGQAANAHDRRRSSYRRRFVRRRNNARREAQIRAILRHRRRVHRGNNGNQGNNNGVHRYRQRPVQRIIIRHI